MNDPLVTIAIPTRNRPGYLKIAIDSAVNQSYANIEVLVSDNASEDGTAAMLAAIHDPRVRTWTQPVNLGMAGNWNFLLKEARGQYFCLLSDDDFLKPAFAARLVDCFRETPPAVFAYAGCEIEDALSTFAFAGYPRREHGLAMVEEVLKGARTLFLCSMMFPTESLRRAGGFPDYRFGADSGAWLPLLLGGEAAHEPEVLAHYMAQTGSITASIPIAGIIGDLEKMVEICVNDSRVPPETQQRFLTLGRKLMAQRAGRLFLHRATLGTPKWQLIQALPSLFRFLRYDLLRSLPTVIAALLFPASFMRRLKLAFRTKREKEQLSMETTV